MVYVVELQRQSSCDPKKRCHTRQWKQSSSELLVALPAHLLLHRWCHVVYPAMFPYPTATTVRMVHPNDYCKWLIQHQHRRRRRMMINGMQKRKKTKQSRKTSCFSCHFGIIKDTKLECSTNTHPQWLPGDSEVGKCQWKTLVYFQLQTPYNIIYLPPFFSALSRCSCLGWFYSASLFPAYSTIFLLGYLQSLPTVAVGTEAP